jgi:hypothetical protein
LVFAKQKSCWCVPRTRQPLCWLMAVCVAGFGGCNCDAATSFDLFWHPFPLWMTRVCCFGVVWPKITFLFFISFPSHHFSDRMLAMQKFIQSLQFIFSFDLVLFFYLHWLFLIEFYFWFHPWSFDFLNLFSNLVLILLISISFFID